MSGLLIWGASDLEVIALLKTENPDLYKSLSKAAKTRAEAANQDQQEQAA